MKTALYIQMRTRCSTADNPVISTAPPVLKKSQTEISGTVASA